MDTPNDIIITNTTKAKEKFMEKFVKRCDSVPYKEVKGEVLLLNLKDGNYFGLNQTGVVIWKMLDGTKTRSDIIKALKKRFNLREDTAKRHLSGFLKELKKNNLIEFTSLKK